MGAKPSMPPRRTGPGAVQPNAPRWHQRLLALLLWLLVGALSKTLRYRIQDPHGFLAGKNDEPMIFCFWHNRLALCVELFHRFRKRQRTGPGVAGLVSASRDGALLSAIFERFGVVPVRGSSSRRGAQALLELTTWSERGFDLAITPDGPRGPRYAMAEGVAALASLTGRAILPVSYGLKRKITLNSWDGFQIPIPFTRCDVVLGRVFQAPASSLADDAEREKFRQSLEAELRSITRD